MAIFGGRRMGRIGFRWRFLRPSPFRERRIHQMVVTREPLPFVYQQLAVAVTGPSGALTVTVDGGGDGAGDGGVVDGERRVGRFAV